MSDKDKGSLDLEVEDAEDLLIQVLSVTPFDSPLLERIFNFFNPNSPYKGTIFAKIGGIEGIERIISPLMIQFQNSSEAQKSVEGIDIRKEIYEILIFVSQHIHVDELPENLKENSIIRLSDDHFFFILSLFNDVLVGLKFPVSLSAKFDEGFLKLRELVHKDS